MEKAKKNKKYNQGKKVYRISHELTAATQEAVSRCAGV